MNEDFREFEARRFPMVRMVQEFAPRAMFRTGTPPVAVPTPTLDSPDGPVVPFRRGTTEKSSLLTGEAFTLATSPTRFNRVVEENGFLYGIVLDAVATTAANSANVAFTEDAPWNFYDSIVLADSAGELINGGGFDLFIANLAGKQYTGDPDFAASAELFQATAGAAATGGSFAFPLRIPTGINRRSLSGIVGNQDRATKYQLRTDAAASGTVYGVAPTSQPTVALTKIYEKYTVPAGEVQVGRTRIPQQQVPPDYGRLHFITANNFAANPTAGATQNHYLTRIGNTIRFIALVFRAGSGTAPRALAQANAPTRISLKIGDDTLYDETWRYRRKLMRERYGFDFPNGVLLYDLMHDFGVGAGGELGDDYYYTQGLNNAQFIIAYPSGFTSGGTLRAITDDLQEVPVAA